jgi:uncharacterized protein (TIGR02594 family)
MKLDTNRWAAVLLCSVAVVVSAVPAMARPAHRHAHRIHAHPAAIQAPFAGAFRDDRYPTLAAAYPDYAGGATRGRRRAAQSHANSAFGGFSSNSLVSEARSYIGTNPTGWRREWCGAFMDLVLRKTGHAGGGNLAIAYARYGTRVSGPQVGAIAVMRHHVGVVSGVDASGNPIIVSGNHNRTVAESVYPRSRIAAYVLPGG